MSSPPFVIEVDDDETVDCMFDTDLLLRDRRGRRRSRLDGDWPPVPLDARPSLTLGARVYAIDAESVAFAWRVHRPQVERRAAAVLFCRTEREVTVRGGAQLVWRLLRVMDGARSHAQILDQLSDAKVAAALLVAALAAAGVIETAGRPIGRFLHTATMREALPGGGLDDVAVAELVTDGAWRAYPAAPQRPISDAVPERLAALHRITRARRSYADYTGAPITREAFDALLHTACGCTGTLKWGDRSVALRAYPSAGALYAVEIYPVVFAVEGVVVGVHHYRAVDGVLETVRPDVACAPFVDTAVPIQKSMIRGAAAMICLTGVFDRFERKYGEGGYRILAAEAGHVSHALILAATALGLQARPCGGVIDQLINRLLGLETDREQFLLSVLVGHANSSARVVSG